MGLVTSAEILKIAKAGAGYYYVNDMFKAYFKNYGYSAGPLKVGGVNLNGAANPQFANAYASAYDNGGTLTYSYKDLTGGQAFSTFVESQVTPAPEIGLLNKVPEAGMLKQTSGQTVDSSSEFIFTGLPGAVKITVNYQKGTSISTSVENGYSSTNEISGSRSYSIGIDNAVGNLTGSVRTEFTNAWAKANTVNFSTIQTSTNDQTVSASLEWDPNVVIKDANGVYKYGTTTLIPNEKYKAVVRCNSSQVTGSITGSADISAPNFGWYHAFGPGEVTAAAALSQGAALFERPELTKGAPLTARISGNTKIEFTNDIIIDPSTPSKKLATINSAANTGSSNLGSTISTETITSEKQPVMLLKYADQSYVPTSAVTEKAALIDIGQISSKYAGAGVYLDLGNESQFNGKIIQITGDATENHVKLGDLDHSLISFRNSVIESGNGFNKIIIKAEDVGNSFKLGGGGDTIDISGDRNYIDAGDGSNVIIVRGSGSNTLLSGPGADIVKFTSKNAMLNVLDWNPNEDKIEIGGDLIESKIDIVYDANTFTYIVNADGKQIANIITALSVNPAKDASGAFEGTKLIPLDIKVDKPVFIAELYALAFDRAPEKAGITFWSEKLDAGLSRNDLIKFVFNSEEFNALHKSNDDYIRELYVDLLGRNSDPAGQQSWVTALDAGWSRAAVVDAFTHSPEFVQLVGYSAPAAAAGGIPPLAA